MIYSKIKYYKQNNECIMKIKEYENAISQYGLLLKKYENKINEMNTDIDKKNVELAEYASLASAYKIKFDSCDNMFAKLNSDYADLERSKKRRN